MAKITFILGLCGSGKTYILNKMKTQSAKLFVVDEGFNPAFDKALFDKNYNEILRNLKEGNDCAVIEIVYCSPQAREYIEHILIHDMPDLVIDWVCIENDVEKAKKNILHRAKNGGKSDIEGLIEINSRLTLAYTYPENVKELPMWQPES